MGQRASFWLRVAGSGVCALGAITFLAVPALAADYPVTTTDDSGPGSLRDAITIANEHPGLDRITFAIGSGSQTIRPGSSSSNPQQPLPKISDPVVIDGTTQPGYSGTPLIRINNWNTSWGSSGLQITGGSSTVRGLAIYNVIAGDAIEVSGRGGNRFTANYLCTDGTRGCGRELGSAIRIGSSGNTVGGTTARDRNVIGGFYGVTIVGDDAAHNKIEGNYIGINAGGRRLVGVAGVLIEYGTAGDNTIGGTARGAGNVISGGGEEDVEILVASGNRVEGNYIGTDVAGSDWVAGGRVGVRIEAKGYGAVANTVGGTAAGAGNVISGHIYDGVKLDGVGVTGNRVQGNFIGTDATGQRPVPNGRYGVVISDGAWKNRIGGIARGAGNLIAYNSLGVGVNGVVTRSDAILSNSIFANDGLGIALGSGNDTEPPPTITSVTKHHGATRIAGTVSKGRHLVELFTNLRCSDPEGRTLIGSVTISRGTWSVTLHGLHRGAGLTATATKTSTLSTSQFSRCVTYRPRTRGK